MDLEHGELTGRIIGGAIQVHKALGPGFIESIYGKALAVELRAMGIPFQRELVVSIHYRGEEVGSHRLDFFVAGKIVVELKAVRELEVVHFQIVKSYLTAIRRKHGLILNFSKPTLEIRRVSAKTASVPGFLAS
jgi:GxxExxY protein